MKDKLRQILASRRKITTDERGLIEAAVLIPIFCKDKEYHILFTQRSEKVPHHKGQVAFPGGARSQTDSSLSDTALRESWEEIGLEAKDVEIIGELDEMPTTSGYNISPFVAFIPYPYEFRPNDDEIDAIFSVPVSVLLHRAKKRHQDYTIGHQVFHSYSLEYKGRLIWGATAEIVRRFLEIWESANEAN